MIEAEFDRCMQTIVINWTRDGIGMFWCNKAVFIYLFFLFHPLDKTFSETSKAFRTTNCKLVGNIYFLKKYFLVVNFWNLETDIFGALQNGSHVFVKCSFRRDFS